MAGRPKADIDWNKVDRLLEAGCLTTEIAAHFGVCADTMYKRCQMDHKIDFSLYSQQKKAKGESLLRSKQFESAMKGNIPMQIWLGKQRLEQRDKPKEEEVKDDIIRSLIAAIKDCEAIPRAKEVSGSKVETEQPICDQRSVRK